MSSVILEQRIIQAILSLCNFSARVQQESVRDDIRDTVTTLIRLCVSEVPGQQMREWCTSSLELLDALSADEHIPQDVRGFAYVAILRLKALIPGPLPKIPVAKTPKATPLRSARALNANEKKVFNFIKDHPRVRTKELIEHFEQTLSDRTIKRVLKELALLGSIERIEHDNAVLYEVLDP